MKQVDENSDGKEIRLAREETLQLRLQENRTTGYKWIVESAGGSACSLIRDAFEPGSAVGQPGTHLWEFRAEQSGFAEIVLSYRRPWEESQASARRFTLHVRVMG